MSEQKVPLSPFTGLQEIANRPKKTGNPERKVEVKEESGEISRDDVKIIARLLSGTKAPTPAAPASPAAEVKKKTKRIKPPSETKGDWGAPPPPKKKRKYTRKVKDEPEPELQPPPLIPPAKKKRKTKKKKEPEEEKGDQPDRAKLLRYLTSAGKNPVMGPYLKDSEGYDLSPKALRKCSDAQLEELRKEVDISLANKSNVAVTDYAVRGGMSILEKIAEKKGLHISGTTQQCFENDHWRFTYERVKLKYGIGFTDLDPVAELSLITLQTASLMHMKSKMEAEAVPKVDLDEEV